MKLSIVTTLYQSATHIVEFHQRASAAAQTLVGDDYEIVLVNDGSPDNSLAIAAQLAQRDNHLIVIDLSRNFGHHKAMMTGLSHARGETIFLLDCDLEEEPEWLTEFAKQMADQQCDVIYGIQQQRKGRWAERWSGQWFYRLFNALTGMKLPENLVTARLMSHRYVDALLLHKERELMIAGLWHITGFEQKPQVITKHNSSKTSYTFKQKMAIIVNSVTAFSNKPLYFIFYAGITISAIAVCYIVYLVHQYYILATQVSGWTSVMASIWLLGGIIISFIGVVAIYLSKIFVETKQRPYTIVREIYNTNSLNSKGEQ